LLRLPLTARAGRRCGARSAPATYPSCYGVHQNSAFGLARALPHALDRSAAGDAKLAEAITETANRWFDADKAYPAAWEPSGSDFLSAPAAATRVPVARGAR
jgi:hypothetical protein